MNKHNIFYSYINSLKPHAEARFCGNVVSFYHTLAFSTLYTGLCCPTAFIDVVVFVCLMGGNPRETQSIMLSHNTGQDDESIMHESF